MKLSNSTSLLGRWLKRLILGLLGLILLYQLWIFGWVLWWSWKNPDTTRFMDIRLSEMQLKNPQARLQKQWVSYAGIVSVIHYEAATGKVDTLSAGFGTCRAETDPASIPRPPSPSGRTALVPGFVAGAFAAHDRFGRLPWA